MPPLSIELLSNSVIKDCFKTTIEYTFVSVAARANVAQEEVKKKVRVLHEVHHLEALLLWRSQFTELQVEKLWNATDSFRNAALLLSADAKEKWIRSVETHLPAGVNPTNARFQTTMNAFMREFCAGDDTEKVRELLLSARKLKDMTIRDFVTRIKQLNLYIGTYHRH
jgi:hypothetical protein